MSERRKLETALNKAASTPPPTLGQQTFPPGPRDDLAGRPLYIAVQLIQMCFEVGIPIYWTRTGVLTWSTDAAAFARSSYVPREALIAFRAIATLIVLYVCVRLIRMPDGPTELQDVKGNTQTYMHGGLWRFQSLTVWCWSLLGVFFFAATVVTVTGASPLASSLIELLLGTVTGYALLCSLVANFILIPAAAKKFVTTKEKYFCFEALMMHNMNLLLLAVELVIDDLHVNWRHIPIGLLWGSTFTLWHTTLRYDWTRTLLYFFLNWQLKGCTVWLTVLKGVMGFGLVLGYLIAEYARAAAWGPAAVAIGAVLSMRLRCPPITAKAD